MAENGVADIELGCGPGAASVLPLGFRRQAVMVARWHVSKGRLLSGQRRAIGLGIEPVRDSHWEIRTINHAGAHQRLVLCLGHLGGSHPEGL
jgi:hypothetical protein